MKEYYMLIQKQVNDITETDNTNTSVHAIGFTIPSGENEEEYYEGDDWESESAKYEEFEDKYGNIYYIDEDGNTYYEDDDDDSTDSLMKALNQVEKFKMELINKDRKYIEKEHIELISKKVKIIEKELQDKMYEMAYRRRQNELFMQMMMQDEYQEQNRRSR